MRVLALDTSSSSGSVAVLSDGVLLASVQGGVDARHGETLLPLIDDALTQAGWSPADIELLAVGLGPGSFTGTRIGLASAKGLVLATHVPLVGVVSLAAMARRVCEAHPQKQQRCVVVNDAGRGQVFTAAYEYTGQEQPMTTLMAPIELPPESVVSHHDTHIRWQIGTGVKHMTVWPSLYPFPGEGFNTPRAQDVAREGLARYRTHGPDDPGEVEPLYVRPSDAKLPNRPLR